jgi:hypothetical protein
VREGDLVRKIEKAILKRIPSAWVRKLSDTHTRGLPDLIAIWVFQRNYGVHLCTLMIEAKKPGGTRSALQEHEASKINDMKQPGLYWLFAESVEDVTNLLNAWGQ